MRCKFWYLFLLQIILLGESFSQTVYDDLEKIKSNYYSPQSQVSYDLKIYYFDKRKMTLPFDSSFGSYSFYKSNTYMSLEGITMISDSLIDVFISTHNKSVTVRKKFNSKPTELSLNFLDSISKAEKIKIFTRVKEDRKTAVFKLLSGPVDSIVVEYNKESYLLKCLFVYYNVPFSSEYNFTPVIKLFYSNQKKQFIADVKRFDTKKIFKIESNKVVLQPAYRKYELRTNLKF